MSDDRIIFNENIDDVISDQELIKSFFLNEAELYGTVNNKNSEICSRLISLICSSSIDEILKIIGDNRESIREITTKNIPQFSYIDHVDRVIRIVASSIDDLDYRKIGYFFNKDGKEGAQRKYGENHYKLAAAMGLVSLDKPYVTSNLYEPYSRLTKEEKKNVDAILMLRIPIIQTICVNGLERKFNILILLKNYLSDSTAKRRCSSIRQIIRIISKGVSKENAVLLEKNLEWSE